MNVAFWLDIPTGLGGAGNLLLKQAALMSKENDVIVVIPCDSLGKPNEEYVHRCEKSNLKYEVLFYKTSFNFYDIDFLNAVECAEHIKAFARKKNINFFHSVQLNIAVEIAARELKIPHLMDIYQLKPAEFKLEWGNLYASYHLCDSQMYSDLWSNKLKIVSRCIRPVAPCEHMIMKKNYPVNGFKILMLGSVCRRKNQLTAIKVIERCLKKYEIQLWIAGDTKEKYAKQCQDYVMKNRLENNIKFFGFVSDITDLLKGADCLLCTSLDESFPSSMVEALSYDLTIISTPVAGVPEIFINYENAFISDDFSEDAIYDSVCLCLKAYQDKDIEVIHKKAEDIWKQNFSPEIVRKKLSNYYLDILREYKSNVRTLDIINMKKQIEETEDLLRELYIDNVFIKARCMYYTLLCRKVKAGKAYIWGAGKYGRLALEIISKLGLELEIVAFIDGIKSGEYCERPVIKPDSIMFEQIDYFFIAFLHEKEEVIDYLEQNRFEYNENIWVLP